MRGCTHTRTLTKHTYVLSVSPSSIHGLFCVRSLSLSLSLSLSRHLHTPARVRHAPSTDMDEDHANDVDLVNDDAEEGGEANVFADADAKAVMPDDEGLEVLSSAQV